MIFFLGLLFLAAVVGVNILALASARLVALRAFGIKSARLWFHDGPLEDYANTSRWTWVVVAVAGGAASYLVACLLFFTGALMAGETHWGTRIEVVEGKAAAEAGLRTDDQVLSIDGSPVRSFDEISTIIGRHAGEPLDVVVERTRRARHASSDARCGRSWTRKDRRHQQAGAHAGEHGRGVDRAATPSSNSDR